MRSADTRSDEMVNKRRTLRVAAPPTLPVLLRSRRKALRMNQAQLAVRIGVRAQTISAWENSTSPQRRFFPAIADFLDLTESQVEELTRAPWDTDLEPGHSTTNDELAATDLSSAVALAISQRIAERSPTARELQLYERLVALAERQSGGP